MKLHIITPALPPDIDAIGTHAALMARELAGLGVCVSLIGPQQNEWSAVPGMEVKPVFRVGEAASFWKIADFIETQKPDWVLLQYNPFGYGRRGLNLTLPRVIQQIRRRGTRVALMAHERYVPFKGFKFGVMYTWQRWQFRQLARASNIIFSSIEVWGKDYRRHYPGKSIVHLPVGSNIPNMAMSRDEARGRLGIEPDETVFGIFGSNHKSRPFLPMSRAIEATRNAGMKVRVVYIGPDTGFARKYFSAFPLIAEGPLAANEVSRRLSAIDVFLSPFVDGVSTRRGSLLAAMDHGLACVGTRGINTDSIYTDADGRAILLSGADDENGLVQPALRLAEDSSLRQKLGEQAKILHDAHFAWPVLAKNLLASLSNYSDRDQHT